MKPTFDLASCLASIPDRRRAEGKMYGQVGVILFSIIAMLSGARSYRQIHALLDRRLAILNAAFPQAALRRAPAYTSVRASCNGSIRPNWRMRGHRHRTTRRYRKPLVAGASRLVASTWALNHRYTLFTS